MQDQGVHAEASVGDGLADLNFTPVLVGVCRCFPCRYWCPQLLMTVCCWSPELGMVGNVVLRGFGCCVSVRGVAYLCAPTSTHQ